MFLFVICIYNCRACFRGLVPLGKKPTDVIWKEETQHPLVSPVHLVPKPWWVAEGGRVLGAVSLSRRTNETNPERIHCLDIRTIAYFLLCLLSYSFRFPLHTKRRAYVQDDYCTPGTCVAMAYAISTLSAPAIYQRQESTAETH